MSKKYKKPNIDEVVENIKERCQYFMFDIIWYQYCGTNHCTDCVECHKTEIQMSHIEYIEQLKDNQHPLDHIHVRLQIPIDGKCGDTLTGTLQEEFDDTVFELLCDANKGLFNDNDNHDYRVLEKLYDSNEYKELKRIVLRYVGMWEQLCRRVLLNLE